MIACYLLAFQSISWDRRVTHCLPPFRKQCQWACGRSRAARGSPSSWRSGHRTTIWPQESPRWKIQPHPRLSFTHVTPRPTPSCPPQFIHSSLAISLQRTPLPFVCTTEILFGVRQTAVSSTSLSALFWYLFLKKLFVLFLLFVLMEALYVSSSSIFHLLRAE